MKQKRNVCVVVTDKAQLSRLLTLLKELKHSKSFHLQLAVGGAALTYKYGNVLEELCKEGFVPDVAIPTVIDGGDDVSMAKTAALGMLEFSTAFTNLQPDMVIVRGDRFEVLPIAMAAVYQNIPLVHLEGGDRSGSIDESVRHAISKLAHIHFVTNKDARERLIRMGEHARSVFNVGCLDIDYIRNMSSVDVLSNDIVNSHGVGANLDLDDEYLVVMQNPVTTEAPDAKEQINETLAAVFASGLQAVWIWPNYGAGADAIAKRMREWQVEHYNEHRIRFIRYLPPSDFIRLVMHAVVLVGNSSTGIKECAWLGVPAVNIGSRQAGRLRAENVVDVPVNRAKIHRAIKQQRAHGKYKRSLLYGNGDTAKKIVKRLEGVELDIQKRIRY